MGDRAAELIGSAGEAVRALIRDIMGSGAVR
jgi:hypothetical protein